MAECKQCGRTLVNDEIGLTKKLINRGATEFYCLDCLADMFKCDTRILNQKIEQFRSMGCTLFADKL
ncbi:MAG: hypothetical protein PUB20_07170 [Clostridia bacterium]|nr:hypothetical protein [Clostridia bacterium]